MKSAHSRPLLPIALFLAFCSNGGHGNGLPSLHDDPRAATSPAGVRSPHSKINAWALSRDAIDWRRMLADAERNGEDDVDVPNFVSPALRVGDVESKGGIRGVVAQSDIEPGQLLVVSRGICAPLGPNCNKKCAERVVREAMDENGGDESAAEYLSWFGCWNGSGAPDPLAVRRMVDTCAFATVLRRSQPGSVQERLEKIGFFGYGSLINHDCAPNCWQTYWGETMIVTAISPIRAEEEVTIMYIFDSACHLAYDEISVPDRFTRVFLEGPWGFVCSCLLCTAHSSQPEAFDDVMVSLRRASLSLLPDIAALEEVRLAGVELKGVGRHGPHLQLAHILAAQRVACKVTHISLCSHRCGHHLHDAVFRACFPSSYKGSLWNAASSARRISREGTA